MERQTNSPLFVEVNIRQDKEETKSIAKRRSRENTTYFKLTYPNDFLIIKHKECYVVKIDADEILMIYSNLHSHLVEL